MPVDVGVDAGGSGTIAVTVVDGKRNVVQLAAANPSASSVDGAALTIGDAIAAAASPGVPGSVVVGAAGAGRADVAAALRDELQRRFPIARIEVIDDARLALSAAGGAGRGIVLISGTGSIAYGENGERSARCGGGGYAIGDEGSGYAIGAAGLRLALRAFDGRGVVDGTVRAIVEATGAPDRDALLSFAYDVPSTVATVASLAPIILRCADDGERGALTIVQTAARELFDLVRVVVREIDATVEMPLALHGGVLQTASTLTYLLETRMTNELPNLYTVRSEVAAHDAALRMAQAHAP
ncbi:MAG TPA: BadF/BadG/BcrA/BcrD ATPase family protein [Candidatus Tumulicola sp.]|jgi:glucosamine kinase